MTTFSIGLKGIEAQLSNVKDKVEQQQKTVNAVVLYSLAEIIYREILSKIANSREVKSDNTADQKRWLTLLFDHGFLEARDTTRWVEFDQIPVGRDLGEFFKPTPAANFLIEARGRPAGV